LRENLRACNWLPFFTLFPPPHFDDESCQKNGAMGVYNTICTILIQGGAILPKVFWQKNSAILANSAIWGTPFVLGAYITGIILAKNGDFA
jgi:hypothetical protein